MDRSRCVSLLSGRSALRWPNLFLVGVAKAGTSSLADYLAQHPDIFMSPVKEPHFFSDAWPRLQPPVRGEAEYHRLFSGATGERLLGEASVSYFWDQRSATAIKHVSPQAKIIVILREPIQRAYSHYWHSFKNGLETRSFVEAVTDELSRHYLSSNEPYLHRSLYADGLRRYLELFGDGVLVLFFEEMTRDVRAQMRKVFLFLAVSPSEAECLHTAERNAFALPRNRVAATLTHSPRARRLVRAFVPVQARAGIERALLKEHDKPPIDRQAIELIDGFFDSDRSELEYLLERRAPW